MDPITLTKTGNIVPAFGLVTIIFTVPSLVGFLGEATEFVAPLVDSDPTGLAEGLVNLLISHNGHALIPNMPDIAKAAIREGEKITVLVANETDAAIVTSASIYLQQYVNLPV